jgi:hypothetical protein
VFWERPIIPSLPLNFLGLLRANHHHHLFILHLLLPTIGVFVNFKFIFWPLWHITRHINLRFTLTVRVKKNSKNEVHLIHFTKCETFPMSHTLRSHAMPTSLFHAAHSLHTVRWWVCPPYALVNPTLLWALGSRKNAMPLYQPNMRHQLIWASMYHRLGLGSMLLAMATKPPFNIWSVA